MRISPADGSYKTFSDLVAGYRLLAVAMHAVRLGFIEAVGPQGNDEGSVLERTGVRPDEGRRFLSLLVNLGVLERYEARLYLSLFSRKFLQKDGALSQLHVLEFERILIEKWDHLDAVLCQGQGTLNLPQPDGEYRNRLTLFQKSMHEAAVVRSGELLDALPRLAERGVIIDLGAGDGTYLRAFLDRYPGWDAVACDLPDVVALEGEAAANPVRMGLNLLEPAEMARLVERYRNRASVVLLSNVIHCYSAAENERLLAQAQDLVAPGGLIVIHDFFTDANGFGALYDAHMLVNTFNGRTYTLDECRSLLARAGFGHAQVACLPSYSLAVIATREPRPELALDSELLLANEALSIGFAEARPIGVEQLSVEPWVQAKCRYGCANYGRKWSCPPHSMDAPQFRELLTSYGKGIVVVGQPPLREFQKRLLELEKRAFLAGMKKALAFSGGPCTWCESCAEDACSFPEKRRPSLEACGCDVFDLAAKCGIEIAPLRHKDDFVQYVGLLLVE